MRKSPLVKYIIVSTVIFLLVICFLRHDNVFRWVKSMIDVRGQERRIEWYRKEISSLEEQIENMSCNVDTLERFARENFLFAEPGDDVYLVPEGN